LVDDGGNVKATASAREPQARGLHLSLHLVHLVNGATLLALPHQHHDIAFERVDAEDVDDAPHLPRPLKPH